MKYLLLLILLAVVFYMLGRKRQPPRRSPSVVRVADSWSWSADGGLCALWLALAGTGIPARSGRGLCSAEHRAAYEAANARP